MGRQSTHQGGGFFTPQLIIDRELELTVIGGCLLSTRLARRAVGSLTAADFPTSRLSALFDLVRKAVAARGDGEDRALRINCCEPQKREKMQLVIEAMDAFTRAAPTEEAFDACCARLRLQSIQRRAALAAWKLVCDACRPQETRDGFADYAAGVVEELEAVVSDLRAS